MISLSKKTSLDAHSNFKHSGKLGALSALIVEVFIKNPEIKLTANELHALHFFEYQKPSITPRMIELERKGLIRQSGVSRCSITGRKCVSWSIQTPEAFGKPINDPRESGASAKLRAFRDENIYLKMKLREVREELRSVRAAKRCSECCSQLELL